MLIIVTNFDVLLQRDFCVAIGQVIKQNLYLSPQRINSLVLNTPNIKVSYKCSLFHSVCS